MEWALAKIKVKWVIFIQTREIDDLFYFIYNFFDPFYLVYAEQARSTTSTTLAFTIGSGGTWKIKVTQIECSNWNRPPPDCEQWITGKSGSVTSYNWANVQLRNTDFTHCIRREQGK